MINEFALPPSSSESYGFVTSAGGKICLLDNSPHPPTPPSLITHPHSIPHRRPVHKNNKTRIAHTCMLVAPPADMIRIMKSGTKGDHQLSGSLILIGWRLLSLSNLMHNAAKPEPTVRKKSCPWAEIM